MTRGEETLAAAAAIVHSLVDEISHPPLPPSKSDPVSASTTNGFDSTRINLPGDHTDGKVVLEKELTALAHKLRPKESHPVSIFSFFSCFIIYLFFTLKVIG